MPLADIKKHRKTVSDPIGTHRITDPNTDPKLNMVEFYAAMVEFYAAL